MCVGGFPVQVLEASPLRPAHGFARTAQLIGTGTGGTPGSGRRAVVLRKAVDSVPEAAIRARRASLVETRMDSGYQRSKCATWRNFLRFMGSRAGGQTAQSCGPSDLVDFLVASDVSGKTVVHSPHCDAVVASSAKAPTAPRPACRCPRRLAFGTIDSMIGRIRSAFADIGRLGQDNPAADRLVKQYLQDVQVEQLRRGVVPRQARPVFAVKIRLVSEFIRSLLDVSSTTPVIDDSTRFALLRTRAMLVLDACSLKRGAELGMTLTDSVIRFPDDSGMIFNYRWGKTLRSGSSHVFGIRRNEDDPDLCAVSCIDAYVRGAHAMGICLRGPGQYLFRPWRHGGAQNSPLAPTQLGYDLRLMLVRCGIFEGETLHGVRTGAAIEMAIKGDSLRSIMDQALWKRPSTAKHYLKVWQVMGASVADQSQLPSRAAGAAGTLSAAQYAKMSDLTGFFSAFSPRGGRHAM